MDTNNLQHLGALQGMNITARKERVRESSRKYLSLPLSLRQEQILTCARVALERSFFPEIEGCGTPDYMVVITAYWLLFFPLGEAAASGAHSVLPDG